MCDVTSSGVNKLMTFTLCTSEELLHVYSRHHPTPTVRRTVFLASGVLNQLESGLQLSIYELQSSCNLPYRRYYWLPFYLGSLV